MQHVLLRNQVSGAAAETNEQTNSDTHRVGAFVFLLLQAQMKKAAKAAAKKAAKGAAAAAAPSQMLYLEKGKDIITEQM